MSNYIVSARKYRPGTFASVVGQQHVTQTLKRAILMDQLAHAFLFSGPRGVGKTTCARILAKAINCLNLTPEGEPCNSCSSCAAFNEGKSMTIHELDAASNNSVDDIRNLIEQTRYVPPTGPDGSARRSVYIIDEVHMLSQSAFNAFLKTLEEPPEHVLFILATTEKHKILPTILSRCQKHDFRRIKVDDIAQHLEKIAQAEEIDYEYDALQQIALKADGALRDALSLFDQLVSYTERKLSFKAVLENLNILDYDYYFRAVDLMHAGDHKGLLLMLHELIDLGFEAKDFLVGLTQHFRNLLVAREPDTLQLLETSENVRTRYTDQSREVSPTFLLNAFNLCSEVEAKSKQASHPRLLAELTLLKLAHLENAIQVASTEAVEKKKLRPKETDIAEGESTSPDTPLAHSEPVNEATPDSESEVSARPINDAHTPVEPFPTINPKNSPPKKSKSSILKGGLGGIKAQMEREKQRKLAAQQLAEPKVQPTYTLDPSIQIEENAFAEAMRTYCDRLDRENKVNNKSLLEMVPYIVEHNCWKVTVSTQMQREWLERDEEMLPFFRKKLSVPSLFIEINVDQRVSNQAQDIPYTEEDKLREMEAQNPSVSSLKKIFKARISFD